jgi:RNA polymerase sigma-70 factor (ECF subfamily)
LNLFRRRRDQGFERLTRLELFMTNADQDKDLIARIAAKEHAAMHALFARHNVRVFRFLVGRMRNEAQAEELTNEVFLEVWKNAGRYEGRSAVSTWVLAIARNMAMSQLRKRKEDELEDAAAEQMADDGDDPELSAQKRSKAELMRDVINQLSDDHREVIDLVYYHEKSVREVSEIVGVPEATVKTRMHYARKALGEMMKEAGIDRGWP